MKKQTMMDLKRAGFTLIELLVVVLVIIVLAGMVFRSMNQAGRKNEEAATRAKLEKLANALEEFRAIYGTYPPVPVYRGAGQLTCYQYVTEGSLELYSPGFAKYIAGVSKTRNTWTKESGGRLFTFGLCSFLVPRYVGRAEKAPDNFVGRESGEGGKKIQYNKEKTVNQWSDYNKRSGRFDMTHPETVENIDALRRILAHVGVTVDSKGKTSDPDKFFGNEGGDQIDEHFESSEYVMYQQTVKDSWGEELLYVSNPPYVTYRLWSKGADKVDGTGDEISVGKE